MGLHALLGAPAWRHLVAAYGATPPLVCVRVAAARCYAWGHAGAGVRPRGDCTSPRRGLHELTGTSAWQRPVAAQGATRALGCVHVAGFQRCAGALFIWCAYTWRQSAAANGAQLEGRRIELLLDWFPRNANAEADRLADGDDTSFGEKLRVGAQGFFGKASTSTTAA